MIVMGSRFVVFFYDSLQTHGLIPMISSIIKNNRLLLSCVLVAASAQIAQADTFLDARPLLKEAVASSAGQELVFPLIDEIFGVEFGNEYPTKMDFRFRVYKAGTTSQLFQTASRGFIPPALPCANPTYVDYDWEPRLLGESGAYTGIAINFEVECRDDNGGYEATEKAFLFMADTSKAGGNVWAQAWSWTGVGFELDDTTDEIQVFLIKEGATTATGRMITLEKASGVPVTDRQYTLVRLFGLD